MYCSNTAHAQLDDVIQLATPSYKATRTPSHHRAGALRFREDDFSLSRLHTCGMNKN